MKYRYINFHCRRRSPFFRGTSDKERTRLMDKDKKLALWRLCGLGEELALLCPVWRVLQSIPDDPPHAPDWHLALHGHLSHGSRFGSLLIFQSAFVKCGIWIDLFLSDFGLNFLAPWTIRWWSRCAFCFTSDTTAWSWWSHYFCHPNGASWSPLSHRSWSWTGRKSNRSRVVHSSP